MATRLLFLALVLTLGAAPSAQAQTRPIVFEPNVGQVDGEVRFISRGARDSLYLSERGLSLLVPTDDGRAAVFRFDLAGASPSEFVGESKLPGRVNYLIGQQAESWKVGVPTFGAVRARSIHPGIDAVYSLGEKSGDLSFRFELAPGARPEQLHLRMPSSRRVELEGDRAFVAESESISVRISGLFVYQAGPNGGRQEIPARFVSSDGGVRIELGAYDRSRPLVIDPALSYASYAGGRGVDTIYDVDVDAQGRSVMVGRTLALSTTPYPTTAGAFQTMPSSTNSHGVVTKVDPAQTGAASLVFSTFIAGAGLTEIVEVDLDPTGRAYITGIPGTAFPTTAGAYQTSCGAGLATSQTFAAILNATGSALDYATCISTRDVRAASVAAHTTGDILIAGRIAATESIPIVNGYPLMGAGSWVIYLMRIDPTRAAASQIVYSTKMGGTGADEVIGLATNSSGEVFLHGLLSAGTPTTVGAHQTTHQSTGLSFWVGKIDTAASGAASLVWGTFAGGTAVAQNGARLGGVAADAAGAVYVTGAARGFATTAGVVVPNATGRLHVAFKVAPTGAALDWATYLDISGQGAPYDITVGPGNAPYIVGRGNSLQNSTCAASASNSGGYLVRLAANASAFEYVTPVPGTDLFAYGVAVDTSSAAHVAGGSGFNGNVTTQGGFQLARADSQDGFLSVLPTTGSCDEIAIEKTVGVSTVSLGDTVSFTVTARNLGEGPQAGVRVTDTLPAGLTLISATPTQGTCTPGNPLVCDLGTIPALQSAAIVVRTTAAASGRAENTAQVTSTTGDGDPANNQASAAVQIQTPCGNLTLIGACTGDRLRFCEDAGTPFERIVEVDCATEAFPGVRGVCTEISPTYGFDCAVPENLTCGFVDGFGDPIYGLCDGTNPGCIVDPVMDAALCRSGVGPCTETGFTEGCTGNFLLVECQVNQPVGFDCGAAGGACRNARCEDLGQGARCNGVDLRCDAALACHTNERCEDPARICDPEQVLPICTGPDVTFCNPRSDLVETFSCRDRVVGAAATCGAPFTCIDDGASRACDRVTVSCVAQGEGSPCDPSRDVFCGVGLSCVVELDSGAAVQRCRSVTSSCDLGDSHAGCAGEIATSCLGLGGLVAAEPGGWDCATFGSTCATTTATTAPRCAGSMGARCDDPALYPDSPFGCAAGFLCVGAASDSFGRCERDPSTPDAGVDAGTEPSDAGVTPDAAPGRDASVPADAGIRFDAGVSPGGDDEGCSCSSHVASPRPPAAGGLLLLGVLVARRRRNVGPR